jgi:hypothetical protein
MEMKPQTIWASVVIVAILVSSATTLVVLDKDVGIILTLAALVALPILGAFGVSIYHKLDQVKEQGNGTLSQAHEFQAKLLEMQNATQQQLTALAMSMTPPPAPLVEEEKEKPKEAPW